jgi:hypothetical protein
VSATSSHCLRTAHPLQTNLDVNNRHVSHVPAVEHAGRLAEPDLLVRIVGAAASRRHDSVRKSRKDGNPVAPRGST